jgi:hypothetical protein
MNDGYGFKVASQQCKDAYTKRCKRIGLDMNDRQNFNQIDLEFGPFKDGWNAAISLSSSLKEKDHE